MFAEDGTLPSNGRHTDGFYYIKRTLATPPTVITPNGGEVWNNPQTITWSNSQTGLKYKIEISKNNGQSWSVILAESAVNATSYSHNFLNESESSLTKIRVTGINNGLFTLSDESNGVFTIQHNVAPSVPTNLLPNGIPVDRLKTQNLSWKHNDSPNDIQSKAEINWHRQGESLWTVVVSEGFDQGYYFPPNTFPVGPIEWKVKTYDALGTVSPWSNVAVFMSAEATNTPTIIQPSTIASVARPVVEWTSSSQSSYQVVMEDSLGSVIWDSAQLD